MGRENDPRLALLGPWGYSRARHSGDSPAASQKNACSFSLYALTCIAKTWAGLKIILTTPTPHIRKKYAPKVRHKMRGRMA